MKQFRNVIAIAVAAVCFLGARAGEVSSDMAMSAAQAWMAANPSFGAAGSIVSVDAEYDGGTLMWWTVKTSSGSALFVSPDTSIEPVIAALPSFNGELPADHPLRAILMADVAKRLHVNAEAAPAPARQFRLLLAATSSGETAADSDVTAAVSSAESKWARFTKRNRQMLGASSVPDGVTVKAVVPGFGDDANGYLRFWNQSDYSGFAGLRSDASFEPCFNLYTPGNAVCGCVATAGAAILQYFGAPGLSVNVTRECEYNGAIVSLTTISATNRYDWSILPQEIGGGEPSTMLELQEAAEAEDGGEGEATKKFNAVKALLGRAVYDMGVCVKMEYSDNESGALLKDLASAFTEDFGFMTAKYVLIGTNNVFDAVFEDLCRTNPVVLGIRNTTTRAGHAILGVGYGEDDEKTPYTRLFMGWGGTGDAWYNLPAIRSYDLVDDAIVSIMHTPPIGHTSIAAAKVAALENHKPILIISGTPGGVSTDALLDYIRDNGYEADFEIYFANYAADPYADQDPSYGIFNPLVFNKGADADNRWAYFNGRLAYGNDTNEMAIASTFADGLEAWNVAYSNYLTLQEASTNGIVVATCDNYNGELYDGEVLDSVFAPGQTVSLHSPVSLATNVVMDGVVWACDSWVVYALGDDGYDVVASGMGTTATFVVAADTAYELYWIWEPDSVLLKVWANSNGINQGLVDPADAKRGIWWPYGETMTAVATPPLKNSRNSQFSHWSGDTNGCAMTGSAIDIPADYPRDIAANFKGDGGVTGSTAKYDLTIASLPENMAVPVTFGRHLLDYGTTNLLNGPMAISVPELWVDPASGYYWRCTGWIGTGSVTGSGTGTTVGFDLKEDSSITWQWSLCEYTLTVDPNGGTYMGSSDPVVKSPNLIVGGAHWWHVGVATRDGYTFLGWFDSSGCADRQLYDENGDCLESEYWTVSPHVYQYLGDLAIHARWEKNDEPEPPEPPLPPEAPIGPVVGGVTNSAIAIYSTNGTQMAVQANVSNASAGYWYSIWSADAVAGPYSFISGVYEGTAKTLVGVPVPEILSFTVVFDPLDTSKFYRVVVTQDEPE